MEEKVWVPKYFASSLESLAEQVLPPAVLDSRGVKGLELMNPRILETIDTLRHNLDVPLIVNNTHRTQSGLRDENFYKTKESYLNSKSQHKYGNALDFVSPCMSSQEIRRHIIINQEYYPHISFLEVGKLANGEEMNWCHIDCRMRITNKTITYWSPKFGFVEENKVLDERL
jgi:hypothetical protein